MTGALGSMCALYVHLKYRYTTMRERTAAESQVLSKVRWCRENLTRFKEVFSDWSAIPRVAARAEGKYSAEGDNRSCAGILD